MNKYKFIRNRPQKQAIFEEHARNVTTCDEEISKHGNYRIANPDQSGEFIYANDPLELWMKFSDAWDMLTMTPEQIYQIIQDNLKY